MYQNQIQIYLMVVQRKKFICNILEFNCIHAFMESFCKLYLNDYTHVSVRIS